MNKMWMWVACALCTLVLLAGCQKRDAPQQAGEAQLPPGVTDEQHTDSGSGLTSLPAGVDEANHGIVEETGRGVLGEHITRAVLDSHGRLGGPSPNSTLAVFTPMLYQTAVDRLDDVTLLQELIDDGSIVFIPNGSEVDFIYETQHDGGYVAIMYGTKRWYIAAEDATLKGGK